MKINKLTVALAVTAAMTVCTPNVFADEVLAVPSDIIAACPLTDCPQKVTPDTATCPKCKKDKHKCKCNEVKTPCNKVKDDCASKNPCPPVASCEEPALPTCAVCPQKSTEKPSMKQVYSYPEAVYGNNQIIGEHNNGLYLGQDPNENITVTGAAAGIPVSRDIAPACGCKSNPTGAAAPLPCLNDNSAINGIPVDRNSSHIDGCGCPVQMHTETGVEAVKKSFQPYDLSTVTGGAAPIVSVFDDVPAGFWASCDINKLTDNNIIAGYPDRTFKPFLPVSRAEMATLTVKGFNLNDYGTCASKHFKDVPAGHWANKTIQKAVSNGLMEGYPDNRFKPDKPVTRAEAFTILAHGINCPMDECKADEILSKYCDANEVPGWAKIPAAKVINAGALADAPAPDLINANKDASRAEIASMLENIRVSLGYSNVDKVSATDCGCTGAAAFVETEQIVQLPTLQLNFDDEISARTATVGDRFAARTIDSATIDGKVFPAGSTVRGKVIEVIRPAKGCQGGLRLSFDSIQNGDCKADLPNQVLAAQVNKMKTPNPVARLVAMPFTWTGGLFGTITRTVGGAFISAGNAVEQVVSGVGVGTGEIMQGQFKAAGRSYLDAGKALVKAPIDTTRTALSGSMGLFKYTGEELAYLVDPKGMKVSSINPKEKITVAFGCKQQ